MELQELYEQIYDQIGPEDTPTSQDLAHEQLQELYDEIYYENMTPDEQELFEDVSSQITSQELCRQMEIQELYEDHCFYEDIEPDEGHVLTSPELRRQMELQELYEQIYDQIEPTCDGIDPKNHAFYTSKISNDQEHLSDESNTSSSNFSNNHGHYSDGRKQQQQQHF